MTGPSRIVAGIVAIVLLGGAARLCDRVAPGDCRDRASRAAAFDAALVKRGRDLAAIGNCNDCHTVRGGRSFAGGLPVPTPFGTIFSSNITPDAETGIGRWSEAAFRRAMRSGVNREGQHLYPTFPYDHFTNVSDEDDRALYAFLMTRQPVRAPARENQLSFPFNQRFAIAGWKLLFLRHDTYQPDPSQSAEWNRGAYLVEGLAHCGACHTPRNALGAERNSAQFAGGDVDNWHAYALNDQSHAPVPWDADALFAYLRDGWHPDHGTARGPMAEVVSNLSSVPSSDVRAIAVYMAGVSGTPTPDRKRQGEAALEQAKSSRIRLPNQCGRCVDLCCGLRVMPRERTAAALWRGQSGSQYCDRQPRSAQSRQYRAVRRPADRRRTQPDHAGICRQHDRCAGFGPVELSARAVQQPAAMVRR